MGPVPVHVPLVLCVLRSYQRGANEASLLWGEDSSKDGAGLILAPRKEKGGNWWCARSFPWQHLPLGPALCQERPQSVLAFALMGFCLSLEVLQGKL